MLATCATQRGTLRSRGNKTSPFPAGLLIYCFVIPPNSKIGKTIPRNCLPLTPAGPQICRRFKVHDLITCESKVQVVGCFPLCQRFRKFRLEFKWKSPFRFLLTEIFGNTSGGGPLISVGIFRPKFVVPFLTNRFFALIREFGRETNSCKSHSYWLAWFNRKMSFILLGNSHCTDL